MRCLRSILVILILLLAAGLMPCHAVEYRSESWKVGTEYVPVYSWLPTEKPAAVVLLIHGMTLHGRRFDYLARELAAANVAAVASDLRGFGAREGLPDELEGKTPVHYRRSENELVEICKTLKEQYPQAPLFLLGESLGANMAFDMAAEHPEMVAGVIACSPCVKRIQRVTPHMVSDIAKGVVSPYRRISLRPYVAAKLSENPAVVQSYLDDPLVRVELTFAELWKTLGTNKRCLESIALLPKDMPVLVLAGEKDEIYSSGSLKRFIDGSAKPDRLVLEIEKSRGHLLVEHPHVEPDLVKRIQEWISDQSLLISTSLRERQPAAD